MSPETPLGHRDARPLHTNMMFASAAAAAACTFISSMEAKGWVA